MTVAGDLIHPPGISETVERAADLLIRGGRKGRGVILFIVYRSAFTRVQAEEWLQDRLSAAGMEVQKVRFPLPDVTDWVAHLAHEPPAYDRVLFVYDLNEGGELLLNSLNYRREVLVERKTLAVFWVTERELSAVAEGAPDFFRFRTAVLDILVLPPPQQQVDLVRTVLSERVVTHDRADLERRIALRERLLADLADEPATAEARAGLLSALGELYLDRYRLLGAAEDVERAVSNLRQAVDLTPPDSPDRAGRQNNLGGALLRRFEALGQVADLEAAIEAFQKALEVARTGSPDWARWQANLGGALLRRFEALGQVADLEAAIAAFQKALEVARTGSPD